MNKVINTEKIPIKLWLDDIEDGALQQAKNLANLPFAFKHVAIMPDSHQGYGMPIGGILATEDVIIPNAVGVDIGCGMCAVQTPLKEIRRNVLEKMVYRIKTAVPVGFNRHRSPQDRNLMPDIDGVLPVVQREYNSALAQIGTLGGGNHFIEIQKGSDGYIWLMIHSGSRNIGFQVANHYNQKAKKMSSRFSSKVPRNWDLAYFPYDHNIGQQYFREMQYCVDFALANRKLMMKRVIDIFVDTLLESGYKFERNPQTMFADMVNIAHNYAVIEEHFGKKVFVHRKGATKATDGLTGIVPGSQGSKSYIVTGRGNPESFDSCSHGAGRKMGRKQAQRSLDLKEQKSKLDKQGIFHSIQSVKDLDEAPGAYKPIKEVMANQADLVKIFVELSPLAVIKG